MPKVTGWAERTCGWGAGLEFVGCLGRTGIAAMRYRDCFCRMPYGFTCGVPPGCFLPQGLFGPGIKEPHVCLWRSHTQRTSETSMSIYLMPPAALWGSRNDRAGAERRRYL